MRVTALRIGGALGWACALALGAWRPAGAQDDANTLVNGDFEESLTVNVTTNNAQYRPLLERGVILPTGTNTLLPALCVPNPGDGWGPACQLIYVEGTAGNAVHGGRRAVRVASPTLYSALGLGKPIPVVQGLSLTDAYIQVGRPHRFAAWVKGEGSVLPKAYMYGDQDVGIYDYGRCQRFQPGPLPVASPDGWQRIEGTFQIRSPEVRQILFVLGIQGDVTVDDVELSGE